MERIEDDRRDEAQGAAAGLPRRFAGARRARILTASGAEVEAVVAERFPARLLGLSRLPAAGAPALLIPRCRSVHTFGMRFAIDVVFLALGDQGAAGDARVLGVRARIGRRRVVAAGAGAPPRSRPAALELAAGEAGALGLEPGSGVRFGPARGT